MQAQISNDHLAIGFKYAEPDIRALIKISMAVRMKALLREKIYFNLMDDKLFEFWDSSPFDE